MSDVAQSMPTVLTVDDSITIQQLVKQTLEPDYRVIVTGNVVGALSVIYREPIAVLLLDVLMPEVDGLEFCRTLRRLPQFQTLPVIMITSKDSPFDRIQGRLAGATEYLTKPFEPDQLRQMVGKFVQ
ncbi:response regulator [Egbenema bharatensis]|uniref:response regulator n=1 Tax=Egbenema bharatensis TaxID=3463334 RepID=UPI003A83AD3C